MTTADQILSKAGIHQEQGPPRLPEEFWASDERLLDLRRLARSRRAPPDATLANVVATILHGIGPAVVLPDLAGDHASLNIGVLAVGKPGKGKKVAHQTAQRGTGQLGRVVTLPAPASGEGLAQMFFDWVADADSGRHEFTQTRRSVFLYEDEGSVVARLAERSGNTSVQSYLKALFGEPLGSPTSKRDRSKPSVTLPAHAYRFVAVVGVQPDHADEFTALKSIGLPQRLLAAAAFDPEMSRLHRLDPVEEDSIVRAWKEPRLPPPAVGHGTGLRVVPVAEQVVDDILTTADAYGSTWDSDHDEFDTHLMLLAEKVATALAAWCRPGEQLRVTERDWGLARTVTDTSIAVMKWLEAQSARRAAQLERARIEAAVRRAVRTGEATDVVASVALRIAKHVAGCDRSPCTRSCARGSIKYERRPYFDAGLAKAEGHAWVDVTETEVATHLALGEGWQQ